MAYMEELKKDIIAIRKWVDDDRDYFLIIEGQERQGKSGLAAQITEIYQPDYDINDIVYSRQQFIKTVLKAKPGSIVWVDEGGIVFCSREGGKKESIIVNKLIEVMGYKNLFIIICVPQAKKLFPEIRDHRMNGMLKVYQRGSYVAYNEENAKKYIKQMMKGRRQKERFARYMYRERYGKPKGKLWEEYLKIKAERIKNYKEFIIELETAEEEVKKPEEDYKRDEYISPKEATQMTGLDTRTLRQLYDRNEIIGFKTTLNRCKYEKNSIEEYITAHTNKSVRKSG